jgi:hypothetical protein
MDSEAELKGLQDEFDKWTIYRTPGGAWVARRKRHFILTESRIDLGFRECLIEESATKMRNRIKAQDELAAKSSEGANSN